MNCKKCGKNGERKGLGGLGFELMLNESWKLGDLGAGHNSGF